MKKDSCVVIAGWGIGIRGLNSNGKMQLKMLVNKHLLLKKELLTKWFL